MASRRHHRSPTGGSGSSGRSVQTNPAIVGRAATAASSGSFAVPLVVASVMPRSLDYQGFLDKDIDSVHAWYMSRAELIYEAQRRLIDRYGTLEDEQNPHKVVLAELINKVVGANATADRPGGTADLRAALELVAADQHAADSRELNVMELLRRRGVSWRQIAWHRGVDSAQRAQQRFQRLSRQPAVLIYAFRVADETDAPWHGEVDALAPGEYETGLIDFNPARPGPYSGRTLEVRYGDVGDDGMEPYLRAFAMVNNRRIGTRANVQHELFGG